MPWSGGVYTRGYASWVTDANNSLPISATKFDTSDNDFASGLNNTITKDGLSVPTSTLNWTVQMNWSRGTDGNVWSIARTGGSNNPKLQGSVTDASGTTLAATGGALALTATGAFTATGATGLTATATAGALALAATAANITATAGTTIALTGATGITATATANALALVASAGNVTFNGTAITGQGPVAAAMVDMTPDNGSWTSTASGGFTSNPTGTVKWRRFGNQAWVYVDAALTGTSNATTDITLSALPAAVTPGTNRVCWCAGINNAGVGGYIGQATVQTNNTILLQLAVDAGINSALIVAANNFGNTGSKGLSTGWTICYPL